MIALSIEKILENVYAFAALEHFSGTPERPEVLGREQEPALRRIIRGTASALVYRLMPHVKNFEVSVEGDNSEIIEIDFGSELFFNLRPALESALAAYVVAVAYTGINARVADTYDRISSQHIAEIFRALSSSEPLPGRITPAA